MGATDDTAHRSASTPCFPLIPLTSTRFQRPTNSPDAMTYTTQLLSVNVGRPRALVRDGREVLSGIVKEPASGRVQIERLGLDGDAQADLDNHGGVDKAVYAYSFANTAHWRRTLERADLEAGSLGENLTLEDLSDTVVALGDVLRVGTATLQVTQPRQPCVKLAMKLGLPSFPKQFTRSGRVGFYLRVAEEGDVGAGDALTCIDREPEPLSIAALNSALLIERDNVETLRHALASPALSAAWRRDIEARLAKR